MHATKEQIQQFAAQFTPDEWNTLLAHRHASELLTAIKAGNFDAAQAITHRLLHSDPGADLPPKTPPEIRAHLETLTDRAEFLKSRPDVREFLEGLVPEERKMFLAAIQEAIAEKNSFVSRYMPQPGQEFADPSDEKLAAERAAEIGAARARADEHRQN